MKQYLVKLKINDALKSTTVSADRMDIAVDRAIIKLATASDRVHVKQIESL